MTKSRSKSKGGDTSRVSHNDNQDKFTHGFIKLKDQLYYIDDVGDMFEVNEKQDFDNTEQEIIEQAIKNKKQSEDTMTDDNIEEDTSENPVLDGDEDQEEASEQEKKQVAKIDVKEEVPKEKPVFDMEAINAIIEKKIAEATTDYAEEIQKLKDEREAKDAVKRKDLQELLVKAPYGYSEEKVKDMSLIELEHDKRAIEGTTLFKDFQEANKEEPISHEDVDKSLFESQKDFQEITRKDIWGAYLETHTKGD